MSSTGQREYTPIQRLAYLLRKVPVLERTQFMHDALIGKAVIKLDKSAVETMQACERVLRATPPGERPYLMKYAAEAAAMIDIERQQQDAQNQSFKLVATLPWYVAKQDGKVVSEFFGSLANHITDMCTRATTQLDMIVPFSSITGARILTKGVLGLCKEGLHLRILTQFMTHLLLQNYPGMAHVCDVYNEAGATIDIRSPTDEQARLAGVLSLCHDKKIIATDKAMQITANASGAGYEQGLEGGIVFTGPMVDKARELFEYVFYAHDPVDMEALRPKYLQLLKEKQDREQGTEDRGSRSRWPR